MQWVCGDLVKQGKCMHAPRIVKDKNASMILPAMQLHCSITDAPHMNPTVSHRYS